ncbi:MAG: endonuclease/exonuclease/phosphatase family protein [Myxococcota bacterium]
MAELLTIGTWNVHGWRDGRFEPNLPRVIEHLERHPVDILGLQEVGGAATEPLKGRHVTPLVAAAAALGLQVSDRQARGNAIASRRPIGQWSRLSWDRTKAAGHRRAKQRAIAGDFGWGDRRFRVVVLHLDHVSFETRLTQLEGVRQALTRLEPLPSVWLGDFNALAQEDYNTRRWAEIAAVRVKNRWEAPMTEAVSWMRAAGFVDCWREAGCVGPVPTCRFDTRIDYIWADPAFLRDWTLESCEAKPSDASDHQLVTANFRG